MAVDVSSPRFWRRPRRLPGPTSATRRYCPGLGRRPVGSDGTVAREAATHAVYAVTLPASTVSRSAVDARPGGVEPGQPDPAEKLHRPVMIGHSVGGACAGLRRRTTLLSCAGSSWSTGCRSRRCFGRTRRRRRARPRRAASPSSSLAKRPRRIRRGRPRDERLRHRPRAREARRRALGAAISRRSRASAASCRERTCGRNSRNRRVGDVIVPVPGLPLGSTCPRRWRRCSTNSAAPRRWLLPADV